MAYFYTSKRNDLNLRGFCTPGRYLATATTARVANQSTLPERKPREGDHILLRQSRIKDHKYVAVGVVIGCELETSNGVLQWIGDCPQECKNDFASLKECWVTNWGAYTDAQKRSDDGKTLNPETLKVLPRLVVRITYVLSQDESNDLARHGQLLKENTNNARFGFHLHGVALVSPAASLRRYLSSPDALEAETPAERKNKVNEALVGAAVWKLYSDDGREPKKEHPLDWDNKVVGYLDIFVPKCRGSPITVVELKEFDLRCAGFGELDGYRDYLHMLYPEAVYKLQLFMTHEPTDWEKKLLAHFREQQVRKGRVGVVIPDLLVLTAEYTEWRPRYDFVVKRWPSGVQLPKPRKDEEEAWKYGGSCSSTQRVKWADDTMEVDMDI